MMKARLFTAGFLFLVLSLLMSAMPACRPVEAAESYMAIMPKVLHSGATEEISIALFKGERLIRGNVEVSLLKDGAKILKVKNGINGKGTIEIDIPNIEAGEYEILVK